MVSVRVGSYHILQSEPFAGRRLRLFALRLVGVEVGRVAEDMVAEDRQWFLLGGYGVGCIEVYWDGHWAKDAHNVLLPFHCDALAWVRRWF